MLRNNRFTILTLLVVIISFFAPNKMSGQTLTAVGNNIPGSLSEYIELSRLSIPYSISRPDSEGNVCVRLTVTFKIKKHSKSLGYFELKGTVLGYTHHELCKFDAVYTPHPQSKVNHNPRVGSQIASAIKGTASSVTVTFEKIISASDVERFKKECSEVVFNTSRFNQP